jgi:hypothetical protein
VSSRVDRLFGGSNKPFRQTRILCLLGLALPLDLIGLVTCTSVPGMVLTLIVLQVIDSERERVAQGMLPLDLTPKLNTYRKLALTGLGLCAAGFVLQLWLLSAGYYEELLLRWSAA